MKKFYKGAIEAIPDNAPETRGKEVDIRYFVDADHAENTVSRRPQIEFFVYINMVPIVFYSTKQTTIEISVFASEIVAMMVAMETTRYLRYKLRMIGLPSKGPSFTYGDKIIVIHNTQRSESMRKRRHLFLCYHVIRESVHWVK